MKTEQRKWLERIKEDWPSPNGAGGAEGPVETGRDLALENEKKQLRQQLLTRARSLDFKGREASDKIILARLAGWAAYREAAGVFLYVGLDWEIHTRPLITRALAEGKRVALPLCRENGRMEARWITSLGQLKPKRGKLKLLEPGEDCPLANPAELELLVAPCLSCDRQGLRLGRGGGYYDRYLAQARQAGTAVPTVALCREMLVMPSLPGGVHDQRVDFVITEKGISRCRQ